MHSACSAWASPCSALVHMARSHSPLARTTLFHSCEDGGLTNLSLPHVVLMLSSPSHPFRAEYATLPIIYLASDKPKDMMDWALEIDQAVVVRTHCHLHSSSATSSLLFCGTSINRQTDRRHYLSLHEMYLSRYLYLCKHEDFIPILRSGLLYSSCRRAA